MSFKQVADLNELLESIKKAHELQLSQLGLHDSEFKLKEPPHSDDENEHEPEDNED